MMEDLEEEVVSFWNELYRFHKEEILNDIHLCTYTEDGSVTSLGAHKLILVGASQYFRSCLNRNELQDRYHFDGISQKHLQAIIDYMYHQITWDELIADPKAAAAVQALQIIQQTDHASQSSKDESSLGNNLYPENTSSIVKSGQKHVAIQTIPTYEDNLAKLAKVKSHNGPGRPRSAVKSEPKKTKQVDCDTSSDVTFKVKIHDSQTIEVNSEQFFASPEKNDPVNSPTVETTGEQQTSGRRSRKAPSWLKDYKVFKEEKTKNPPQISETVTKVEVEDPLVDETEEQEPKITLQAICQNTEVPENHEQESPDPGTRKSSLVKACLVCDQVFWNMWICKRHMMDTHHDMESYTCKECGQEFQQLQQLISHHKEEHTVMDFSCDQCKLKFKTKDGFKIHNIKHHGAGNPRYICNLCGKAFYDKTTWKSHHTYIHNSEKPFKCDLCPRAFKAKAMLARHKRTVHSNERKYQCDVCEKRFKAPNDLKIHKKTHQQGHITRKLYPEGQEYPCTYCGKVFTKRHLQMMHESFQHKQKMEGAKYICTLCNKAFDIKHYLLKHLKTIHNPKRFSCEKCHKVFTLRIQQQRHIESGKCRGVPLNKPHVCTCCGKSYTLRGNLTKHIQNSCKGPQQMMGDCIVVLKQPAGDVLDTVEGDTEMVVNSMYNVQADPNVDTVDDTAVDAGSYLQNIITNVDTAEGGQYIQCLQENTQQAEEYLQVGKDVTENVEYIEVHPEDISDPTKVQYIRLDKSQPEIPAEFTGDPVGGVQYVQVIQEEGLTPQGQEGGVTPQSQFVMNSESLDINQEVLLRMEDSEIVLHQSSDPKDDAET